MFEELASLYQQGQPASYLGENARVFPGGITLSNGAVVESIEFNPQTGTYKFGTKADNGGWARGSTFNVTEVGPQGVVSTQPVTSAGLRTSVRDLGIATAGMLAGAYGLEALGASGVAAPTASTAAATPTAAAAVPAAASSIAPAATAATAAVPAAATTGASMAIPTLSEIISGVKTVAPALQFASSYMQGRSAQNAAQREQQAAATQAGLERQYGSAALSRAQGLEQFMPQYTSIPPGSFRPVNLTTGYGTTTYNPATGQYESQLAGPLAQQQQFSYGAAQNLAQQLGSFDPNAFAQQRYQGYQSLLEPSRQAAAADLLSQMKRKGLLGFAQTAPGGTSTQAFNPMTEAFARAQEQQNRALALQAFGEGTTEQNRLANLQQQMFGQGVRLNEPLTQQLQYGYNLGGQEYQRALDAANYQNRIAEANYANRQRLFSLTEPYQAQSALAGSQGMMNAAQLANQSRLAGQQGMFQGLTRMFTGAGGGNTPSAGMFTPYIGTSVSPQVSSEVSNLGSSTWNPLSDYWTGRGGWGSYGE